MPSSKKHTASSSLTLALVQSATVLRVKRAYTGNVLILGNVSKNAAKFQRVRSSLNIVQAAAYPRTDYINVVNNIALSLVQTIVCTRTVRTSATDNLALAQSAVCSVKHGNINSNLNFVQVAIGVVPVSLTASNNLSIPEPSADELNNINWTNFNEVQDYYSETGLRHSVEVHRSVTCIQITDRLNLTQSASKGEIISVGNHLHLRDSVLNVAHNEIMSQLILTHSITVELVTPVTSALALVATVTKSHVAPRTGTSALALVSAVTVQNTAGTCLDHLVGAGYTPPTLTRRKTVILTYPYTNPILTLELRSPDFDNHEQFEFRRINRRSRGNTLQVYRDRNWPKAERLQYQFSNLSTTKVTALLAFLDRSLGDEIGLLDFESRQWKGVIITPSAAMSQKDRTGSSISLDFEGELV